MNAHSLKPFGWPMLPLGSTSFAVIVTGRGRAFPVLRVAIVGLASCVSGAALGSFAVATSATTPVTLTPSPLCTVGVEPVHEDALR